MSVRDEVRRLVEELPESELPTARRLLEALQLLGRDPRQLALDLAPWDDEPTTPEEDAGVAVAYEERAHAQPLR